MQSVDDQQAFRFNNGFSARNITELKNCIEDLPIEDFEHHVNKEENDFSKWIKLCLHEPVLADELLRTKSKEITLLLLKDWLLTHKAKKTLNELHESPSTGVEISNLAKKLEKKPKEMKIELQKNTTADIPRPKCKKHKDKEPSMNTGLLVKEFIFGMIIGLILGIVLMKIISLF